MTEGNTVLTLHNESLDRIEELLRDSDHKSDAIIANTIGAQR
jgi:hypothetical protein